MAFNISLRRIFRGGKEDARGTAIALGRLRRKDAQMKRSIVFSGVFFLAAFAVSIAHAAKPQTSKAQLEKGATHIVVGKVRSISLSKQVHGQFETTRYVAEVVVDEIEKGEGLQAGDVVHARYQSTAWRGIGAPVPYDSGHRPRPMQDDSVRVYLVNKGYNGAGYTTDGGYDVYYNNGFEILALPSR